ncbi:MAG: hypothetical protein H7Y10_09095 [Flavobacterium sp.]|nr:hypothetical protein [Flavobacterium sp.]
MRNSITILSVILFGLFSCKKDNSDKKIESLAQKIKARKNIHEKSNPKFSQNDFSLVYQYTNEESNQILGINIIDEKNLKFHLVTETLPCDTEYWGIAENKNWNIDSEIDEDKNGGYFTDEYIMDKAEYTIGIRLALDSSKVIIKYLQKDGLETDCLPITRKIMERIK